MYPYKRNKYNAKKTEVNGIVFDSKKEAKRYTILKEMLDKGEISDLQLQVKYELLPKQLDINGKSLFRPMNYIADFVYKKDGETIVEDTKGVITPEYKMKKKLMYFFHKILIQEI